LVLALGKMVVGRLDPLHPGRRLDLVAVDGNAGGDRADGFDQALAGRALVDDAGRTGREELGTVGPAGLVVEHEDGHAPGGVGDMSEVIRTRERVGVDQGGVREAGRLLVG